jgi:hypothetical protein
LIKNVMNCWLTFLKPDVELKNIIVNYIRILPEAYYHLKQLNIK